MQEARTGSAAVTVLVAAVLMSGCGGEASTTELPDAPISSERTSVAIESQSPIPTVTLTRRLSIKELVQRAVSGSAQQVPTLTPLSLPGLPSRWDWSEHGAVTSVKDQGPCGASP